MAVNGNVLPDLSAASRDELLALVSGLRAKLATQATRKTTLKISEKGALSVYGLGRFPVTLYKSQWNRLLSQAKEIEQFITDNDGLLAEKD